MDQKERILHTNIETIEGCLGKLACHCHKPVKRQSWCAKFSDNSDKLTPSTDLPLTGPCTNVEGTLPSIRNRRQNLLYRSYEIGLEHLSKDEMEGIKPLKQGH